jgi:type I restriction-modification system DNA methylase subunit
VNRFEPEMLRDISDFSSLIKFLRNHLNWPLDGEDVEDLTFDYTPEELGISEEATVKINYIKQLRPFMINQPWGIFYIDFENKKLPIVLLRRILQKLVLKKKHSANRADIPQWHLDDLLFINSYGDLENRSITFTHFKQDVDGELPALRVITWNSLDNKSHLELCVRELEKLEYRTDLESEEWQKIWSESFKRKPQHTIKTAKNLSLKLADLAKKINENALTLLRLEQDNGPFRTIMKKFQQTLIHDLKEEDFADIYAQTIAYGLLYTAISGHVSGEESLVSPERVKQLVLPTNPFLKEVMESFFDLGVRRWSSEKEKLSGINFDELGVNEIVDILKSDSTDLDAVLRDFGSRNPNEDPVIHFYELFLKEYSAAIRKGRGVYYTPRPVVNFIVRSVNEVLKNDFGLKLGLADTITWREMLEKSPEIKIPDGVSPDDFFVQILDPACGTGTFLVETIDHIHNTMLDRWRSEGKDNYELNELWNRYVPKYLLPRLYGFELMMAPYAITHMKIGIKLYETGYTNFADDQQRVKVYLTNSLEGPIDVSQFIATLDPAMAEETREANEIKQKKSVTVVIGNPPYSVSSSNKSQWIENLMVDYKKGLNEKNIQPLSDDYIKFIRLGQFIIENNGIGILAYISNNSFLDGIIHRQMRKHLSERFEKILILNLHGNSKKKEISQDGSPDQNVFDIMQGVSVSILLSNNKKLQPNHNIVQFYDLYGRRVEKIDFLLKTEFYAISWTKSKAVKPYYLYTSDDLYGTELNKTDFHIDKIFNIYTSGIKTHDDNSLVSFEPFISYNMIYSYKAFDIRYLYYDLKKVRRHRYRVMRNMVTDNLGLCLMRSLVDTNKFSTIFITKSLLDGNFFRFQTYLFPLYIYNDTSCQHIINFTPPRAPNFDKSFVGFISKAVNMAFISDGKGDLYDSFGPEDVLAYIYSVFHSPAYRNRYAELLKIDFPRIPFTSDQDLFVDLVHSGHELIKLHLLESESLDHPITSFPVKGDNLVTKVGEAKKALCDVADKKGKLFINSTQYFDNLPLEIWNFHIGSYQVCYKWLYDRKKAGRKLSNEDIQHYHKIVVSINETIKIMNKIDETIDSHGGWPIK